MGVIGAHMCAGLFCSIRGRRTNTTLPSRPGSALRHRRSSQLPWGSGLRRCQKMPTKDNWHRRFTLLPWWPPLQLLACPYVSLCSSTRDWWLGPLLSACKRRGFSPGAAARPPFAIGQSPYGFSVKTPFPPKNSNWACAEQAQSQEMSKKVFCKIICLDSGLLRVARGGCRAKALRLPRERSHGTGEGGDWWSFLKGVRVEGISRVCQVELSNFQIPGIPTVSFQ